MQNPVLTQAQCAPSNGAFTVRVSWQFIQGQTYFTAAVFDPSNTIVAHQTVDGSRGTTVALMPDVTLDAATAYTVRVAQSDEAGTPTSSYSQPFTLLQAPLTGLATVNDLTRVAVSATPPAVGSPTGISAALYDSTDTRVVSASLAASGGVIVPPQPLDPALTYYVYLSPSADQGLSTGANQRVDLQMAQPEISAITYDGANMTVSAAALAGATLTGTLFAGGAPIQQKAGGATSVSFALATAALDLSKLHECALRAVTDGNAGPASPRAAAVVAPPRLDAGAYTGGHVSARWTPAPVAPVPTGAVVAAIADGQIAGHPVTTLGYQGDIDISTVTVASSLTVQVNSVFGVAKGPPASVDLPFSPPVLTAVSTTRGGVDAAWTDGGTAPGYRLSLTDTKNRAIAFTDTGDLAGGVTAPVNPDAVYALTVQPCGSAAGVDVQGPVSDAVAVLAAAPVVTATVFDGAHVTVSWDPPAQAAGITGYEAVLLDADTLNPTGASATAEASASSVQIAAALTGADRVVAAVRATGEKTAGALAPAVEVIAVTPVITATDASAARLHVAWTAAQAPAVTGYTVTISDDAATPTTSTFNTTGPVLDVPNTLHPAQIHVRVTAVGARSTGPSTPDTNLFGDAPSYYPAMTTGGDPAPYLVRSTSNQPAPADLVWAFPDVFTTPPATLPSAGVFMLEANPASTVLPYTLTLPANSIAWSFDAASRATLASDFLDFLKAMEMPNGTDVAIKPGALTMVRQSIALGLPLLYCEQLSYMYGFDPDAQTGGYVDLTPGMRLRVDSSVMQVTPPANNQMGYVPAGAASYDIQSYAHGQALDTGFNAFLSALARPTVPSPLVQPNAGGGGVIDLYTAAGRQPYFRLLYPSAMQKPTYTALVDEASLPVILGAPTYTALLAATDRYVSHGDFTGVSGVFPFYFRGRATLTPQVSAQLDGEQRWLALGSTVADLIAVRGALPTCVPAAVGGFAMRRSVAGLSSNLSAAAITTSAITTNRVRLEYPPAVFSPLQPGYFGLPLFCGDDIRLSQDGLG